MAEEKVELTGEFWDEFPENRDYREKKHKSHLLKVENHIATLTFNRPEVLNAHADTWEVMRILDCLKQDPDVRVLVITGTGRGFHAGANIKRWSAGREERAARGETRRRGSGLGGGSRIMMGALYRLHKVSIAMVNGPAMGMGLDWALACDMRIASERAIFGCSYINQGLQPADGAVWYLPRLVGMGKAMELALTGKIIDAQEALRIGLVNQVVPHDELEKVTYELADLIANKKSPMAVQLTRNAIYLGLTEDLPQSLDSGGIGFSWSAGSEDSREAMRAWAEKREPRFE